MFVTYWSWRGIFLINVPIGLLLTMLCALIVPRSAHRARASVDVLGVALLGIMILSIMFGFAYLGIGSTSASSWQFLTPELTGAAAGVLFVQHIRGHASPFVPIRLLCGRGFAVMNFLNLVYGGAVLGIAAVVPLYAEQRYGLRPLAAGTLLTGRAVGMIAIAGIASLMLRRTGARRPIALGFLLLSVGLVLLAVSPLSVRPYDWLVLAAAVTGLGMGTAVPATNNATLQLAPDHVAAIAGLRGMFRQSGSILALSVTTALVARAVNPAQELSHIFVVFAVLLIVLIPVTLTVPEHHGSW